MDDLLEIKKTVTATFKISGFFLKSEPATYLAQQLLPLDESERKSWLDKIRSNIQNQCLENPNIEKNHLDKAFEECSRVGAGCGESIFSVINAFDIPTFKYNNERKKFLLDLTTKKILLPQADSKAKYIRERYIMLLQRTSRHELFSPMIVGSTKNVKKFQLKRIESLLSTSKVEEVIILGLLTQLTEGKFFIEDPTGVVQIDLSEAKFHSGLFCEGCFVLAEGKYADGILKIAGLGFPPAENSNSSRAYFGTINTWGGPAKTLLKYSEKLKDIERSNTEDTIVFLSDCWLDHPNVIEKLEMLFTGYEEFPPIAIILMGPFAKTETNIYSMKQKFTALGDLLSKCQRLKRETDIVLVPSADDPSAPNILPRSPIPEIIVADLKKKAPRIILATNPCRLQYCTQQIVVCRADLVTKLCRNTLQFPQTGQLEEHFARTLICQGTLAPLNPIALPTYWDHDDALLLYPLPDLIVIGDPSQGFQTTQQECTVVNTGSFPKSKYSFKVYIPSSKTVEDSQIPED